MENLESNIPLSKIDLTKSQIIELGRTSSSEEAAEPIAEISQHSIKAGPTDQQNIPQLRDCVIIEYTLEEAKQLSSRTVVEVFKDESEIDLSELNENLKQKAIQLIETWGNFKWNDEDKNSCTYLGFCFYRFEDILSLRDGSAIT